MRIITLLLILIFFFVVVNPVQAFDLRPHKLAKFLGQHGSLLANYADEFVHQADRNRLDYRLLPAISGVESTFGRNYIAGTYNVYGWGKGSIPFGSWVDGIAKVSTALRTNYYDRGAVTIEQVGRIYDPPGAANWAYGVNYFMDQIENTQVLLALDMPWHQPDN